jgi:tellurite resistance protein TerC
LRAGVARDSMARWLLLVIWIWLGFVLFILLMLALDLGVFHRRAHVVRVKEGHGDPGNNVVARWTRRLMPVTERFHGEHFVVRAGGTAAGEPETPGAPPARDMAVERAATGTRMLTPLALSLILVESTDLVFAVDPIPAIFAITADPFLVFTSNVFAILGLRSLYFALAGMMDKFRYLKVSLAAVLALVGAKMLAGGWLKDVLGEGFNLYVLGVVVGVLASLWADRRVRRGRSGAAPLQPA